MQPRKKNQQQTPEQLLVWFPQEVGIKDYIKETLIP